MPTHVLYTGKKRKKSKFNRLQIEVFFPSSVCPTYISPSLPPIPPNIGPSKLFFVHIYAQGLLRMKQAKQVYYMRRYISVPFLRVLTPTK